MGRLVFFFLFLSFVSLSTYPDLVIGLWGRVYSTFCKPTGSRGIWVLEESKKESCLIHLHLLDYDNENLDDEWAVKTCGFSSSGSTTDRFTVWLAVTNNHNVFMIQHRQKTCGLKGGYNISPFVYSFSYPSQVTHISCAKKNTNKTRDEISHLLCQLLCVHFMCVTLGWPLGTSFFKIQFF